MNIEKKPEWLRKKIDYKSQKEMGKMLRDLKLHTVCEEAHCPNMGECFRSKTATFMIMGNICTRNCKFCAVSKGKPNEINKLEAFQLAEAAKKLDLKHIVITSVTRDDINDGGASHFANCIFEIRKVLPGSTIEVLIPDLQGEKSSLDIIIAAKPEIISHNIETVNSLYPQIRAMANYEQSLNVIKYIKEQNNSIYTKSGIMLGLGEKKEEILNLFDDLLNNNCDMLTIGQYLAPSHKHAILKEYISPKVFDEYKEIALEKGFKFVASGPYIRSSYHAQEGIMSLTKYK